jgi:diaminopimelate epimerase
MTPFFKLSGSGNDFVALVEPAEPIREELIRAWCRRGVSLGADGVFSVRRTPAGVEMDYFNADGLPADLCLNGTRCAAQLAFHLGWAESRLQVVTPAGAVQARRRGVESVTLELSRAATEPQALTLDAAGASHTGYRLQVGVPHFVLPWPGDLAAAPVRELGAAIRHHPLFAPQGTNVNFVQFSAPSSLRLRTYERGVEDETLSCGSGIVASVATGLSLQALELPVEVETEGGFMLRVEAGSGDGSICLTGDARVVARGELLPEAAVLPRSPSWRKES